MINTLDLLLGLAEKTGARLGLEIDNVELFGPAGRRTLRVTIDKPEGVTLKDCESFSKDYGALLDVEDPIDGKFILEVGSPGLDRPLKRPKDFQKSTGKRAKIVLKAKTEGKQVLEGMISDADQVSVTINTDAGHVKIDYAEITRARLVAEI